MNFLLSEEQILLRDSVREFAEKEIAPKVKEMDEKKEIPKDLLKKIAEMGYFGIIFPSEYGGAELSYIDYCIILEEISKFDPSIGLTIAAHNSLCSNHIYLFGNDEQKKKFLTRLAKGETLGAWALTESGAGSDAGAIKTTAKKVGDKWIINGTKVFCTNGSISEIIVVMAVTDKSKDKRGISAFIVEKGTKGFSVGKREDKLGVRASDTAELIFEDAEVPEENLLGEEGKGYHDALTVLDGGRVSIAAFSLGIAQGALESAIKYSKERIQFGQSISNFQAIQWMLAEMATEIEASRLLTLRAAQLKDKKVDAIKESSMAKYYSSEVAVKCANFAVQIFGGYGFTKDYPVEKLYRDSKIATIGEGTSEIQKLIIAKEVLEK
ncbi:MAG: acyl-CoA dehydrogenase [Candidatus Aminicenantia bacterium]